jgi:hypothetical protein
VKFSTLILSIQGNDTNIIIVADKVKACIGKLGLWVRNLEGKSMDMFYRLKDFVRKTVWKQVTLALSVLQRSFG